LQRIRKWGASGGRAYRNAFNAGPSSIFDFDGDDNVTQNDFIQFRNRFNLVP